MEITVPEENDKDLVNLLKHLASHLELVELKVEPELGSQISDCTEIVRKKVEEFGGRIIYGWQLWKSPFIIEAEFHAVWETPDEKILKDITPKPEVYGIDSILFLEDEELVYKGKQIDNIRLNITDNKIVDHFIETCKAIFRLNNKGDRALAYDLNEICSDKEIQEINQHERLRIVIAELLNNNKTIHDLCFCDSNKKYKNCHGKDFVEKIREVK